MAMDSWGKCPKCGCEVAETETDGHCNSHGEPNYQVTTVTYYCAACGEGLGRQVFDTRDVKEASYG